MGCIEAHIFSSHQHFACYTHTFIMGSFPPEVRLIELKHTCPHTFCMHFVRFFTLKVGRLRVWEFLPPKYSVSIGTLNPFLLRLQSLFSRVQSCTDCRRTFCESRDSWRFGRDLAS